MIPDSYLDLYEYDRDLDLQAHDDQERSRRGGTLTVFFYLYQLILIYTTIMQIFWPLFLGA